MRIYLWITGITFGLLTAVHIWRMTVEKSLLGDPPFLGITALSAALAIWAFRLLLRSADRAGGDSNA